MSFGPGISGPSSSRASRRVCILSSRIELYSRGAEVANLVVFARHASPFIELQRVSSQYVIITMRLRPRSNNEAMKKRGTRLREVESQVESGRLWGQPVLNHVVAFLSEWTLDIPRAVAAALNSLSPIDPVVPPRWGHWLLPKGLEDVTARL